MTKIAICQIRQEPQYRRDAFVNGLKAAGYSIVMSGRPHQPTDLLVIWNRYGGNAIMADTWERMGGTVLVCENGYIGQDKEGRQLYAISAHGHNGSGWWNHTGVDRFAKLNIEIRQWQNNQTGHMLVCGQRGIGTKIMASPVNWHNDAAIRLRKLTEKPIKIRLHPGNNAPAVPLDDDLKDSYACVIWSSSSGVKALVKGYPVFYDAPFWICSLAGMRIGDPVDKPNLDNALRVSALINMADAQWTVDEISSGEPFKHFETALNNGRSPV